MTDKLDRAGREVVGMFEMLADRFPQMKPQLDEELNNIAAEVVAIMKPLADYCEGRITKEEYIAITKEREAADLARRREHYGEGPLHTVHCEHCLIAYEWDEDERGEPPPIYFECEDITGEDCQELDDEDNDEEEISV